LRLVSENPAMRIGADGDGDVSELVRAFAATRSVDPTSGVVRQFSPIGKRGAAKCSQCKKIVNPANHPPCGAVERMDCERCGIKGVVMEGHAERCVIPEARDPVFELIGDARHSLDVKLAVVSAKGDRHFSRMATEYVSAVAQRRYLASVGQVFGNKAADHACGSSFERQYKGRFRKQYLVYLFYDLQRRGLDFSECRPGVVECGDSTWVEVFTAFRESCYPGAL